MKNKLLYSFVYLLATSSLVAQDSNFLYPIQEIEQKLQYEPFEIFRKRDARYKGDIPKRLIVKWQDGKMMQVKLKAAEQGGTATNNEPRYEIAAYQLQKLFLEPEEYAVPPTFGRSMPLGLFRGIDPLCEPTFKGTTAVFYVLQYWLEEVSPDKIFDKKRFKRDTTYARHLANMNILSSLVRHNDSNTGNFLISRDTQNPRVFMVDNGLAFDSQMSNRGYDWQKLRVKRLPEKTVAKLRKIEITHLQNALGVVAQFAIISTSGQLEPTPASENLNPKKGVRRTKDVIQFGLTEREIGAVHHRLKQLLKRVDSGKIKTFGPS